MKPCKVQLNLCSGGRLYPQMHILETKDLRINHLSLLLKWLEKEKLVKL